jgi:FkbH-like protein
MRRQIWSDIYVAPYGQYHQELLDPNSGLHEFDPTAIVFAFDARHALGRVDPAMDAETAAQKVEEIAEQYLGLWELARKNFSCTVIQQTILPVFAPLLGNNEHRLSGSPRRLVNRLNQRIAELADDSSVDLMDIDARSGHDGIAAWHDPVLWHRAKMDVSPTISPVYGDLVARLVAAQQGRSYKCLVLDLDNTLWGGVIGDDGLEGIVLGQGSAHGEAFVDFQEYVHYLSRRGLILAVCSKNDEANAVSPFENHPEMVLKREHFASFVANWNDKASNLRAIAEQLNIGIDSLVFVDDNPFERNLVRTELPMVAVPELPEDPARYAQCIADGGYFEGIHVTLEDLARTEQYRSNAQRENLRAAVTDIETYLKSLEMKMSARPFDEIGLARITQLINKTNQFNLTTRRYSEQEVAAMIDAPDHFTLQVRLTDKFGDNGMICVVIAVPSDQPDALRIDTWLMSCRVLGRQVEHAVLNVLADGAMKSGYKALIGEFCPTQRNSMVKDHYEKLGFIPSEGGKDGQTFWTLPLDTFAPLQTHMAELDTAP